MSIVKYYLQMRTLHPAAWYDVGQYSAAFWWCRSVDIGVHWSSFRRCYGVTLPHKKAPAWYQRVVRLLHLPTRLGTCLPRKGDGR